MNRKKMTLFNYVNGVFLLLLVIVCILPILHVIALSLSERIEAVAGNVTFYPIGFTLEAYRYVMEDSQFWTSLRVTLTRVLIGVPANILLVVMTAYPLSKANSRFHARTFFSWLFVITMLFSGGLIASYINMTKMGLNGTIWAVLFPAACSPYTIILMRTFFEQIPTSMEESAFIDGANDFHVFTKITIPLSKPIISTVVLLFAVNRWNSWFNEFIYLTDKKLHPLQLVIRSIVLTGESEGALQAGEVVLGQSLKYAVVILAMIPMLILYPLIQKYLVKGIMLGAVKG